MVHLRAMGTGSVETKGETALPPLVFTYRCIIRPRGEKN